MLSAQRFDCIPLGIDEIERVYSNQKKELSLSCYRLAFANLLSLSCVFICEQKIP